MAIGPEGGSNLELLSDVPAFEPVLFTDERFYSRQEIIELCFTSNETSRGRLIIDTINRSKMTADVAPTSSNIMFQIRSEYDFNRLIRIGRHIRDSKGGQMQNIGLAFSVKFIVLIMGAGGLATMWEAVFADVGVALLAILNAVRIQRMKFE